MNPELHLLTRRPTERGDGAINAPSELLHECPVVPGGQQVHGHRVCPTGPHREDLLRQPRASLTLLPSGRYPPAQMLSIGLQTRRPALRLEREGNKISANDCNTLSEQRHSSAPVASDLTRGRREFTR